MDIEEFLSECNAAVEYRYRLKSRNDLVEEIAIKETILKHLDEITIPNLLKAKQKACNEAGHFYGEEVLKECKDGSHYVDVVKYTKNGCEPPSGMGAMNWDGEPYTTSEKQDKYAMFFVSVCEACGHESKRRAKEVTSYA